MKYAQKAQLLRMRMQGIGYAEISQKVGRTEDEVWQYCRSNGLDGDGSSVMENHEKCCRKKSRCRLCGKKLIQPVNGRPRRFCSGRCRTRYCRLNKEIMEVPINE